MILQKEKSQFTDRKKLINSTVRYHIPFILILFFMGLMVCGNLYAKKSGKGELNASLGKGGDRVGLVKGIAWYLFPHTIGLEANVGFIHGKVPISGNLSLNLPLNRVVPFITAGMGICFDGSTVKNIGGGIKINLSGRRYLRCEYRYYASSDYFKKEGQVKNTSYIGIGFSYLF